MLGEVVTSGLENSTDLGPDRPPRVTAGNEEAERGVREGKPVGARPDDPQPRAAEAAGGRARAFGGHPSVTAMRAGRTAASATTSPPPVSMSSADSTLAQPGRQEARVPPRRSFLGGATLHPAEVPPGHVGRDRLPDEVLVGPHPHSLSSPADSAVVRRW